MLAALALISCRETVKVTRPVPDYLARILADTTSRDYNLVKAYDPASDEGGIYIIGSPEDVMLMAEAFLSSDRYDNITGRGSADHLPDFAGETICPVIDLANYPYDDYIALSSKDLLSEITLADFIFAMDTTCRVSPYDTIHRVRKSPAKAVVVASTYSCIYGFSAIDSLCRRANPYVTVVSALDEMMDQALSAGKKTVIWTSRGKLDGDIYKDFLCEENGMGYRQRRLSRGLSDPEGAWSVFAPAADSLSAPDPTTRDLFFDLLDNWQKSSFPGERISSIILEDSSVDVAELKAVIDELKKTDDDFLLHYRNMLSPSCELICPEEVATRRCYGVLRSRNTFTHRIAYPGAKCYSSYPSSHLPSTKYDLDGNMSYSFKYNREGVPTEGTFIFVELRDKYLKSNLLEFMKDRAPKLHSQYAL